MPRVIESRCTACGKCVAACPRKLFALLPKDKRVYVRCLSAQKGAVTAKLCAVGCIKCKKCEKACPFSAIRVGDAAAVIDPAKCTNCGLCVKACPKATIEDCVTDRKTAYVQETCTGSGKCQEVCPVKAIDGEDKARRVVNPKCIGCGACVKACPTSSIVLRSH